LTRPLVLLLSRGLMNGYAVRRPEIFGAPEGPAASFGSPPRAFVPQKRLAIRRAALLCAGVTAGLAALALWWVLRLF
jgi:hypothetical protein